VLLVPFFVIKRLQYFFFSKKLVHSWAMQNFSDRLTAAVQAKNSCFMLGLDPNIDKMPDFFTPDAQGAQEFCAKMMAATHDLICGVKIQMAYFEQFGSAGIKAVEELLALAKELDLITMVDGKRNDIGSTADAYAKAYLENGPLAADCMTVNPLLGTDGIAPFIKRCEEYGRGIFVLVRTSNPSAQEFQGGQYEMSRKIAEKVEEWNITTQSADTMLSSVGAVIGATIEPEFLKFFREEMPHAWFLCPGVGAQGGSIDAVKDVQVDGLGVLVPVSRAVLYASDERDFAEAGRDVLQEMINAWDA
jgi:orotidine-5'-phosphate decarboxylase